MKTVNSHTRLGKIRLGGTARNPETVLSLKRMGLDFAEIGVANTGRFEETIPEYAKFIDNDFFYLFHGPREGDPNSLKSLEYKYLPEILTLLPLIPRVAGRLLTIHLWLDPRFVRNDVISYKIGLLRRIIDAASQYGIRICIENLSESEENLIPVFEALPELGLTLDVAHAQLLTYQNTCFGFIKKYPERIQHIHIHDNLGGNSPEDDLHLPVGQGIIDFVSIFKALGTIGYKGTITMELRPEEIEQCIDKVKGLVRICEHYGERV